MMVAPCMDLGQMSVNRSGVRKVELKKLEPAVELPLAVFLLLES